jgi:hypothetical protein
MIRHVHVCVHVNVGVCVHIRVHDHVGVNVTLAVNRKIWENSAAKNYVQSCQLVNNATFFV